MALAAGVVSCTKEINPGRNAGLSQNRGVEITTFNLDGATGSSVGTFR